MATVASEKLVFRVLHGHHEQVEEIQTIETEDGGKRDKKIIKRYGPGTDNGDVVESKGFRRQKVKLPDGKEEWQWVEHSPDLAGLFNTPNSMKFMRLNGENRQLDQLAAATRKAARAEAALVKALEKMSVRELIEYAEAEEIDLGKLGANSKKDDVIRAIRAWREGEGARAGDTAAA